MIYAVLVAASITLVRIAPALYSHFHGSASVVSQDAQSGRQGQGEIKSTDVIIGDGISLISLLVITWFMARIERRQFGMFGLGGPSPVADCAKGLATGLGFLSLLVSTLWAMHLLVFDGVQIAEMRAVIAGTQWLFAFIVVGVTEEYIFRGYLQYTLARGLLLRNNPHGYRFGFWIAAVVWSAMFLLAHVGNGGESAIGLLGVFLNGLVGCYALWRTGSLWWAIGAHASWDWAQSFLYGASNSGLTMHGRLLATHPIDNPLLSGGATGPEGSILGFGVFFLNLVVIRFMLPKREHPSLFPRASSNSNKCSCLHIPRIRVDNNCDFQLLLTGRVTR